MADYPSPMSLGTQMDSSTTAFRTTHLHSCSKSRECTPRNNEKNLQTRMRDYFQPLDLSNDSSQTFNSFDKHKTPDGANDVTFIPPCNTQRTFFFEQDQLEFSSEFDNGNLIHVERVGVFEYNLYNAMDCSNSIYQTNGRNWFHFSVRGGFKGSSLRISIIGVAYSAMFTHEWKPVMAVFPSRPIYSRIKGFTKVHALEYMPATPNHPLLLYVDPLQQRAAVMERNLASPRPTLDAKEKKATLNLHARPARTELFVKDCSSPLTLRSEVFNHKLSNEENEEFLISRSPLSDVPSKSISKNKNITEKKKKYISMTLDFDVCIEADIPLSSVYPLGHPECPAIYIAANYPYSYTTLQRNLYAWQALPGTVNREVGDAPREFLPHGPNLPDSHTGISAQLKEDFSASKTVTYAKTIETEFPVVNCSNHFEKSLKWDGFGSEDIYFHREILCYTLEGRRVDLLTISEMSGAKLEDPRMAMLSEEHGIPVSSSQGMTTRPLCFSGKRCVVLSARVHAGESPASHMIHGCIEFLLNRDDPRARALRQNFVFFIVPMLNPDGVLRGHSRADAAGVDLNRTYRSLRFKSHPASFSLWALLMTLSAVSDQLALFVDMHAHSNQRGIFFYGNSMDASAQLQNVLYAKLVSLNTPYLEFKHCDFTESNMSGTLRAGTNKSTSCRVALYTEAAVLHSYTIEASYVEGNVYTPIAPLSGALKDDDEPLDSQRGCKPRYVPKSYNITGKAILIGLLDFHSLNPVSRMLPTNIQSIRAALERQLKVEIAERLFLIAHKAHGCGASDEIRRSSYRNIFHFFTAEDIPNKLTLRGCRELPPITLSDIKSFLSIEEIISLLEQTPPLGPPRSLIHDVDCTKLFSTGVLSLNKRITSLSSTPR